MRAVVSEEPSHVASQAPASAISGCPASSEARADLHRDEICHCGALHPVRKNATEAHLRGWGLPTHACPATPYLLTEYPELHKRWLSEGRVLVHCSSSGGFGDYLRSIPSVVVLSMMLELALVLLCDVPVFDSLNLKREQELHKHMPKMFWGPHFDWRVRVKLGANHSSPRSHSAPRNQSTPSNRAVHPHFMPGHETEVPGKYSIIRDLTGQQMVRYTRAPHAARVYSNAFAHARRLIKFNMVWAKEKLGAYAEHANEMDIDHCMLRYILAPTEMLSRRLDETLGAKTSREGSLLIHAVSTHVRVGDVSFANAGWASNSWKHSDDVRNNLFLRDVPASLQCLLRASETAGGACMPCILVSDSPAVGACARLALDAPVLTVGVAVHMLASDGALVASELNVAKIFVDWWLLARSLVSVEFGAGSAFFASARGFKQVSSPKAIVIPMAGNVSTTGQRQSMLRACGAPHARATRE